MRERAKQQLKCYRELAAEKCQVDVVVSEGQPFLEILQKAEDFTVDAIVIGKTGTSWSHREAIVWLDRGESDSGKSLPGNRTSR